MVKTYIKPNLTGSQARAIRRSDGLIEYRDRETNGLLFLYDPRRRLIQIQKRGRRSNCELPLDTSA